jgi:hypothetical protein
MDLYYEKVNELGNFILQWAKPEGWPESPLSVCYFKYCKEKMNLLCLLQSWPLTSFETAITIALGYLTFVFVGSVSEMQYYCFIQYIISYIYSYS